jgi:hypothetical protein
MAAEAAEEIRALAERLKRETRHVLTIELCERVLAWRAGLTAMAIATATVSRPVVSEVCPTCTARRVAKAVAMRKWRAKRRTAG